MNNIAEFIKIERKKFGMQAVPGEIDRGEVNG